MTFINKILTLTFISTNIFAAAAPKDSFDDIGGAGTRQNLSPEKQKDLNSKGAKGKGFTKGAPNQGQGTSTAYANDFATIDVDVQGMISGDDASFSDPTSASDPDKKRQEQYSTVGGAAVAAVSVTTFGKAVTQAKTKDSLKKKLEKNKFKLQDVSGEKAQKDPREEMIADILKAKEGTLQ